MILNIIDWQNVTHVICRTMWTSISECNMSAPLWWALVHMWQTDLICYRKIINWSLSRKNSIISIIFLLSKKDYKPFCHYKCILDCSVHRWDALQDKYLISGVTAFVYPSGLRSGLVYYLLDHVYYWMKRKKFWDHLLILIDISQWFSCQLIHAEVCFAQDKLHVIQRMVACVFRTLYRPLHNPALCAKRFLSVCDV